MDVRGRHEFSVQRWTEADMLMHFVRRAARR
jgi:hypothetical protein